MSAEEQWMHIFNLLTCIAVALIIKSVFDNWCEMVGSSITEVLNWLSRNEVEEE